eukprot:361939-Chlamydomonas_euryale.AAC.4
MINETQRSHAGKDRPGSCAHVCVLVNGLLCNDGDFAAEDVKVIASGKASVKVWLGSKAAEVSGASKRNLCSNFTGHATGSQHHVT